MRCGRRGIYTNKLGYLGGINCNLLCAFVCQADPKAKALPSPACSITLWQAQA